MKDRLGLSANSGRDLITKKDEDIKGFFENDFKIFIKEKNIPFEEQLNHLSFGILGLCINGNALIDVYTQEYNVSEGGLVVILPNQLVSIREKSSDFRMNYFIVSQALINDVVSGIYPLSPLFYIHIRRKHYYQLASDEIYRFKEYYNLISNRMKFDDLIYQKEYITNTLRLFYLDLYSNLKNRLTSKDLVSETRKERIAYNFFLLIIDHFKENREIYYYANRLCITPKYLTTIIKQVSGRSAKEWINEYIMMEIKYLLKNTSLNIQEITVKTMFSNQASLGRFFKKHTGMSPSEYRLARKKKRNNI
ncbi:MAG: helix-turn-helix domain-containing protein [Prevotella sp.]|jgi:AraC-like DNA-binding protein|nr:helix-turn-helix domain-containing protein [Prevotella sp.]